MNDDNQNPIAACYTSVRKAQSDARRSGVAERSTQIYFDLVSEAVGKLIQRPNDEVVSIVTSLNSSQRAFLRGISTSGAIWSVRDKSREWLILGLKGLYLEDQTNDPRETITKLAILNHSAKKIGIDLTSIENAAFGTRIDLPQTIVDYLANPVQDIASVGYAESTDANGGFNYTRVY